MFFLLRTAFWLSVMLLVLPLGLDTKSDGPDARDRAQIDAMSAFAAAGATVSDMGSFCSRQPDACAVGGEALKLVGERAKSGAALIQDYLATGSEAGRAAAPAAAPTPAAAAPKAERGESNARNTLSASDRKPAWRAPSA